MNLIEFMVLLNTLKVCNFCNVSLVKCIRNCTFMYYVGSYMNKKNTYQNALLKCKALKVLQVMLLGQN